MGKTMASAIDPTKPADGVPAQKADLRANLLAAKREIEILQQTKITRGEPVDMQGHELIQPLLKDVYGPSTTPTVLAGALTLDLESGNAFQVTVPENVVSLTFANPSAAGRACWCFLILKQDGTGGRTIAWPRSIRWPGGVPPLLSVAGDAVDIFAFVTRDGGATWYGFVDGNDFR